MITELAPSAYLSADSLQAAASDHGLTGESETFTGILRSAFDIAKARRPAVILGHPGAGKSSLTSLITEWSGCIPVSHTVDAQGDKLFFRALMMGFERSPAKGINQMLVVDKADMALVEAWSEVSERNSSPFVLFQVDRDSNTPLLIELCERIGMTILDLPSLEEREEEIPFLASETARTFGQSIDTKLMLTPEALAFCSQISWPRNFHDLFSVIRQAYLSTGEKKISEATLRVEWESVVNNRVQLQDAGLEAFVGSMREQLIFKALERSGGSQSGAARLLKVSPQAVHQYLKQRRLRAAQCHVAS